LKPVHDGHIAVHEYDFIILSVLLAVAGFVAILAHPLPDEVDRLLPVEGPVRLQLQRDLEHRLQGHDVEHVVVHDQDVAAAEARAEQVGWVCGSTLEHWTVSACIQCRQVLIEYCLV
jgi:hypothetical protein